MTLRVHEEFRAFHVGSWYEAYWLQPTKEGTGQSAASVFARALVWLSRSPGWISWTRQVVRALPQEGALLVKDDAVVHARQLLLGVEGKPDNHSTTATATLESEGDPAARGPRRHAYALIWWGWHAYKRSRERARLRDVLSSLSDRELRDIGIHRSEIEYIVSAERPVQHSASDDSNGDLPAQYDPSARHRVAA